MNNLTMIAAIGKNNELGKNNDLIWHFKEDMKFFKEQTIGKPIVMGRKTFESLPKLLPKRKHIILSRKKEGFPEEILVINNKDDLLKWIDNYNGEVMVIGGATIYSQLLEYSNKLILTEIDACERNADVYFPLFNKEDYEVKQIGDVIEENNTKYKHLVYTRKK